MTDGLNKYSAVLDELQRSLEENNLNVVSFYSGLSVVVAELMKEHNEDDWEKDLRAMIEEAIRYAKGIVSNDELEGN